jgi:predicted amidohydrolase
MIDVATVGIAQWLPAPGRPEENLDSALHFIAELAGCDLVVLPELWPCGYDPRSLAVDARSSAEPLDGRRSQALGAAARAASTWLAAGSVPELAGGELFNTALLFSPDGTLRGRHRKAHLYSSTGEDRAFSAGTSLTACETEQFGCVGLVVCFDGDFPEVARTLRLRGARVILHVSAYEHSAEAWWDRLYPAYAMANGQWWIMANQCGSHGGDTLLGGSKIVSPLGEVAAQAVRTVPGKTPPPDLLVAEIRLREGLERAERELGALLGERRPALYGDVSAESSSGSQADRSFG